MLLSFISMFLIGMPLILARRVLTYQQQKAVNFKVDCKCSEHLDNLFPCLHFELCTGGENSEEEDRRQMKELCFSWCDSHLPDDFGTATSVLNDVRIKMI